MTVRLRLSAHLTDLGGGCLRSGFKMIWFCGAYSERHHNTACAGDAWMPVRPRHPGRATTYIINKETMGIFLLGIVKAPIHVCIDPHLHP